MKIKTSANKIFENMIDPYCQIKCILLFLMKKINLFLQIFLFYYTLSQYF